MKLVVTGSIAYDYLMHFPGKFSDNLMADQLDNISVSFLVNDMVKRRGGVAPNIAYTIALLGGTPTVMGTAGQDFGEYRQFLDNAGVDTSAIKMIGDKFTASFFANTDIEQNQIASFYAGAMQNAGELSFAADAPDADLTIISPNDPGAMLQYIAECKEKGIKYIYDPSQQTSWLSGDDLQAGLDGCYLLTVNEYEFNLIQEKTGLSAEEIQSRANGTLITKGKSGSTLTIDGNVYEFPVVAPTQVVDPTGAGDAFRAGLMRSIQLGLDWEIAGRVGALCSTYVIEGMGPQDHAFTPVEFVARFRQNFDDNGALNVLL